MIIKDFSFKADIDWLSSFIACGRPEEFFNLNFLLYFRLLNGPRRKDNVLDLKIFLSDWRLVKGVYSLAAVVKIKSLKRR